MAKLGFIVARPTQIESPFYQYVSGKKSDLINVYYFKDSSNIFYDPEIGKNMENTWGIDLFSGYQWELIRQNYISNALSIVKNNTYNIVNGYTHSLTLYTLLFGKLYKKKIGLRLDTVLWNQTSVIKKVYKYILLRFLSLFVDTFWVTGSKSTEYLLHFGISNKKIKTLSYVVDIDWFKSASNLTEHQKNSILSQLEISNDKFIIVCVTKLTKRESPIDLIKAFNQINLENKQLLIIGDGDERGNLENYVKNVIKNKNIKFTGYVKYALLPQYYSISSLFVHTSINEPWGVSVQEAMSCGLPVIASNFVGSAYDLVRAGENGYIYQSGDIEDLSNKISLLCKIERDKIISVNESILKNWSYESTWLEIDKHIENINSKMLKT